MAKWEAKVLNGKCTLKVTNEYLAYHGAIVNAAGVSDMEIQQHFDEFFEEVYQELDNKVCIIIVQ